MPQNKARTDEEYNVLQANVLGKINNSPYARNVLTGHIF